MTLNQVFHILDEDPADWEPDTGRTRLAELLRAADRVNLVIGRAPNLGAGGIAFRQLGIRSRTELVPLLRRHLEAAGKLVVVEWV